ncbi:MAG: AI-2E family transporter [Firmicutes bacterium]|nr:AI-2E family transporter [Bacillota bacterium]
MRHLRSIVIGAGILFGMFFLFLVRGVLGPFFLGGAVAYLAYPAVAALEKRQVPRQLSIILVYLVFAVVIGLVTYVFMPSLLAELNQILLKLPDQTDKIENITKGTVGDIKRLELPANLKEMVDNAIKRSERFVQGFAGKLVDFLVELFSKLFWFWLAPVIAYYVILDWDEISQNWINKIPSAYKEHVVQLFQEIDGILTGFVLGRLIVSGIVGVLITLGSVVLDVQFATLLGILAGIFDLIPYLGPVVGAVPAVIFAFLSSPWKALWVVALFFVVNQLEAVVFAPRIVGGRVGLHPVVTVFALLAGGRLWGIAGVLVAVPVAATIRIFVVFLDRMLRTYS